MTETIGVLAPLFPPAKNGGGPIRTLEALVAASPEKFRVRVLTGDRDLGAAERLPVVFDSWLPSESGALVYYASASSMAGLLAGFKALRMHRPGVIYMNGYFDARFSILPQLLWRFGYWRGAVRLLAPRGEFGKGALSRRSMKKRAYVAVYRMLRLHRGVYWHASSRQEAEDIRRLWGDEATVLIRENETLLPARADASETVANPAAPLRAVFLGRIVEHKGLHIALAALGSVHDPVRFDVFGPEEDVEYARKCRALASALPKHITVNFNGSLAPERTREALAGHDVLLMPTAGENFGHVIAEALSVSCPVLCSRLTPWTEVLERGGGGEAVPLDATTWAKSIAHRASSTTAERLAARQRAGRAYEEWRSRPAEPHVFELLDRALGSADNLRVE